MKKFQKALASLGLGVVTMFTGVGCGDADKVVGAEIMAGSMATTIAKGASLDTNSFVAQIKMKNGETKTVSASELTFDKSAINTSQTGEQKLKVKYGDFEFEVTIIVVATEADVASIASLESQLVIDYNSNKGVQENKTNEFYQKDINGNDIIENIKVGDDNDFNFRLNASGWDGAGKLVEGIKKVRTNVVLEKLNGSNFEVLEGDEIHLYLDADIDTENTVLNFSDDAIGSTFKVTVSAVNAHEAVEENATKFSAVLDVVDGWNVYNATDLSIYENTNRFGWKEKKLATGMAVENDGVVEYKTTNAIILQDNITVTKNDIPDEFFWNRDRDGYNYAAREAKVGEGKLEGTPKDGADRGLYNRFFALGDATSDVFKFEGNYFMVDMSQFPKAVASGYTDATDFTYINKEEGKMMTSCLATFYNDFYKNGEINDKLDLTGETSIHVRNVKFFGNTSLNENTIFENSGGIFLMENQSVDLNAYNTIHHNFYIGYFTEDGMRENDANAKNPDAHKYTGNFNVNYSKGYDAYSTLFYCYGSENLVIRNSEFVDCGGPAIIANHGYLRNNDRNTGSPTHVNIINSTVTSKVTGEEGWFKNYSATAMMQQLGALDAYLAGYELLPDSGKTMYVGEVKGKKQLDLVGIIMDTSNGAPTPGGVLARGHIRMFDTEADYEAFYAGNGVNYGLDMDSLHALNAQDKDAYYIEDALNGGYFNSGLGLGAGDNTDTSLSIPGQLTNGYRLTVLETVLADGINLYNASVSANGNIPEALKATFEYANLPLRDDTTSMPGVTIPGKLTVLKGILQQLVTEDATKFADPTQVEGVLAGFQNLLKVYGAGRVAKNDQINTDVWQDHDDKFNALYLALTTLQQSQTPENVVAVINAGKVLLNALCSEINQMTNKTWGEGDYFNLYVGAYGMGLTLGVVDRPVAED